MEEENKEKKISPLKAIRLYCLACSNGSSREVQKGTVERCELFNFRFGKNPNIKKRILSEEEKLTMTNRLKNARKAKAALST